MQPTVTIDRVLNQSIGRPLLTWPNAKFNSRGFSSLLGRHRLHELDLRVDPGSSSGITVLPEFCKPSFSR